MAENNTEFNIQRLYVKDISFEAPNAPEIFQTDWEPDVKLDMDIDGKKLTDDLHEVVVKLTVTTKLADKTAFLVEIKQAGIFLIKNFTEEQLKSMYGSFCPNILFPYAREVISELTTRGGFPPLYLAPINFDALYQQKVAAEEEGGEGKMQ